MSSRVGSAALALTAAALLAGSIMLPTCKATSSFGWWSGHPTIENKTYDRRNFHIGLIQPMQSRWCNTDGSSDTDCHKLSLGTTFISIKYAQLGVTGVLALVLVGLGIAGFRSSGRRRMFGKLVLVIAGVSATSAIVLLLLTPAMKTDKGLVPFAVPVGYGLYLFFGAVACSIVASVLGLLQPRAGQQVVGWNKGPPVRPSAPPVQPAVDVHALLQQDALRPSSLGPEPMMGRQPAPPGPSSPGGMLPGPSGPLAPVPSPGAQPLFSSAPQLRPLYEASANQGGTGGYVPLAPPQLPSRGPTPMPRAAVSAITGLVTPPPVVAPPPPINKTLPPPLRSKPPSLAPPIPRPSPPGASRAVPRSSPTISAASVPPPRETPMPSALTLPVSKPGATLAGPPGMQLPRVAPDHDDDDDDDLDGPLAATSDFEKHTIDRGFDAMATTARPKETARKTVDTDPVPALFATGDSTSPSVPFETTTGEAAGFATFSTEIPTQNDQGARGDDEDLETMAREKISAGMPAINASARVSDPVVTSAPPRTTTLPPPPAAPEPAPRTSSPVKIPISTAPDSLPPPKEKSSAMTGPSPACPQCEAPMGWVEEHLRFYCKSCRMYF